MCSSVLTEAFDILFKFKVGERALFGADYARLVTIVKRTAHQTSNGLERMYTVRTYTQTLLEVHELELMPLLKEQQP